MDLKQLEDLVRDGCARGLNDAQIADECGFSWSIIRRIRRGRLQLTSTYDKEITSQADTLLAMHSAGASDAEIAKKLGVSVHAVYKRRERKKLKPNNPTDRALPVSRVRSTTRYEIPERPDHADYDEVDRRAMAYCLFCRGYDDEYIIEHLGIDRATAERYRREMPDYWPTGYNHMDDGGRDEVAAADDARRLKGRPRRVARTRRRRSVGD